MTKYATPADGNSITVTCISDTHGDPSLLRKMWAQRMLELKEAIREQVDIHPESPVKRPANRRSKWGAPRFRDLM